MDSDPSIAELVVRARRGDPTAFDPLVRRHLRAAHAVALAVLGRAADAEDVVQDALVTALDRLDDCREPARFSGWLLAIVRNRALNALERRKLRDAPLPDEPTETTGEPADVGLRARLHAALATLTPIQREIVLLHDLDGWTHAELADALGITEVNSRQHLFTARRSMRAVLDKEIQDDQRTGS